ncbi:MAG: hypothetical protein OXP09_00210 [Gammaproteobacteria bacterium]|nr:hypothetical protein [Rhodospirillaceae bacterium]MDE0363978.1 hypothetical protein [Gammaproteobacteria bacterium]
MLAWEQSISKEGFSREAGIQTRILAPARSVSALRDRHQKPRESLAEAVSSASVTNLDDTISAAMEMTGLIDGLSKRGIDDIQRHLQLTLDDERVFRAALQSVRRAGLSASGRAEEQRRSRVADRLSRDTGLPQSDLLNLDV